MLNTEQAKTTLLSLREYVGEEHYHEFNKRIGELYDFVSDVEALLKYNAIKQVPALFKPS